MEFSSSQGLKPPDGPKNFDLSSNTEATTAGGDFFVI